MSKKRKEKEYIQGTFIRHRNGFGFVVKDDKREDEEDIYISAYDTNGAMNEDRVIVDLIPKAYWYGQRPEGIITKVTKRNLKEITGTFMHLKRGGVVFPADRKHGIPVLIDQGKTSGAKTGDKVVALILKYPDEKSDAKGHITSIIARKGEKGADIKELISSKGLKDTFPSSAKAQASYIDKTAGKYILDDEERKRRRDLTGRKIFTIDGAYSKDFDDAVSISRLEDDTYLLGVHIADVAHYVTKDSPLDKEAMKRGNSVYVLDTVVPMLPFELSNGICSLNEGEIRLTLSVDMKVNKKGEVYDHEIYESFIRSSHRLIYDDVSDILENYDEEKTEKYIDIKDDLFAMKELFGILEKKRNERGSIDFDVDEAEIKLDESGKAVEVGIVLRRTANKLIEEFMLLANETVAQHFYWLDIPFIYRVHEKPESSKMNELRMFLESISIPMKADPSNVHPKVLNSILEDVKGTEYENIVGRVMLRCMQKAYYGTECAGHYGLSLTYYTHFTSPIRRYSDLFIHRIIKEYLHGNLTLELSKEFEKRAVDAASIASKMERLAIETERDGEKMKKAEYMSSHVGGIYDAIVSGITNSGIFVELPNTVEGMVRFEFLDDDYYDVDSKKQKAVGRRTRRTFLIGDKVKVVCKGVNMYEYTIDFKLVERKKKRKRRS